MTISKDQEDSLRGIQDKAVEHAIEEMTAASELGIESKEERGDRFWLTKMAEKSMTFAAKVEQYILLKQRDGRWNMDEQEEKEAIDRMVSRARGEVDIIIKRVKGERKTVKE
jgi:hypothetical protein